MYNYMHILIHFVVGSSFRNMFEVVNNSITPLSSLLMPKKPASSTQAGEHFDMSQGPDTEALGAASTLSVLTASCWRSHQSGWGHVSVLSHLEDDF